MSLPTTLCHIGDREIDAVSGSFLSSRLVLLPVYFYQPHSSHFSELFHLLMPFHHNRFQPFKLLLKA